jgi:hypothetical protein
VTLDVLGISIGHAMALCGEEKREKAGASIWATSMLDRARDKAEAQGLVIRFVEVAVEKLDLAAATQDLIVERHVIWTLLYPETALDSFNAAAAQIGVEGRHLRQRISLSLQLTSARRQQARPRGEPGHQGGSEGRAVGDVFSAKIQAIDRDPFVPLAGRADNADCAIGQKHRGDLESWQLRYLLLPRRASSVR